jgi:hypothetical protein
MDLLDRYLAAISRELPKAQARDVTAELRDTLLSQIEEREAGLGHKLDRKELEALLKDFGHPLVVAGRYRKIQHLIGPEVFPFWFATIRVMLGIELAIWLGALVVSFASANTPLARITDQFVPSLLTLATFTFGVVTLVFAVIERVGVSRLYRGWSPRKLPAARVHRRGRFQVASEMVTDVIVLLWWTGLIYFRDLVPIPAFLQVQLAPIWNEMYWPIIGYLLFEMGVNGLELFNPGAAQTNAGLSLVKSIAGFAILVYLLQAGHWVQVDAPSLRPEVVAKIRIGFDQGMRLGLIGTAFLLGGKAVWDLWRLVRASGPAPRVGVA